MTTACRPGSMKSGPTLNACTASPRRRSVSSRPSVIDVLPTPLETPAITTARWLTYPDAATRRDFERQNAAALATDVDGNPVFLATSKYNLQVTIEHWPRVGFHATREHGRTMAQGHS